MIIVNQNRDEFVNFDNIMDICMTNCEEDRYGIFAGCIIGIDDNYKELGYYKIEERAKEVLKEISIAYGNTEMIKIPEIEINEKISTIELIKNICYEMPKK